MKISSDTYMMMQANLVCAIYPVIKEEVSPSYVKAHVDMLLKQNNCEVVDVVSSESYLNAKSVNLTITNQTGSEFKL